MIVKVATILRGTNGHTARCHSSGTGTVVALPNFPDAGIAGGHMTHLACVHVRHNLDLTMWRSRYLHQHASFFEDICASGVHALVVYRQMTQLLGEVMQAEQFEH